MTQGKNHSVITMRVRHDQPSILVERHQVDDDTWDELAILVAEDQPLAGRPMIVAPDALIRRRRAVRGILQRNKVSLEADEAVQRLLSNSNDDDRSIRVILDNRPDIARRALDTQVLDGLTDPVIVRELRPFQRRDLDRLLTLRHGANFSVPGAGKTMVTYVLHAYERNARRVSRLLVVAPLSAFEAWEDEAAAVFEPALTVARWYGGPVPNADVVLVNYQRLPSAVERFIPWMARHAVHLVIDEAHRAKRGATGGWGRALLRLSPFAIRRDILTGTPAPNHPRDLAALLDILWPGGLASGALPQPALRANPSNSAMLAVNGAIQPLYVRTTKEELGLPAVEVSPVIVRLGPLQRAIYDAMVNRYSSMFDLDRRDSAMFAQMGEVVMYLLQAACSPKLLAMSADPGRAYRYPPLSIPPGSRLARLVEDYADHEVPAKVAHACSMVRANAFEGRKTLVWSFFPENLLDLEQQLAGLRPALIYGSIPSTEDTDEGLRTRQRELRRFRSDPSCMVLLANPAAMAEGVSLHHTCHDAVYLDRTFNAGQYLQSLDRIHRLGLPPDTVTRVTLLLSEGTIDERVDFRIAAKTRRLSRMLADPGLVQMSLPDDDDYGEPIDDPADLEEILRHLRESVSPVPHGE